MTNTPSKQTAVPPVLWTAAVGQPISQPPLVMDGLLLLATHPSGRLVYHSDLMALDLGTGEIRWQHHFEYALISGLGKIKLAGGERPLAVAATSSTDLLKGEGSLIAFEADGRPTPWLTGEQHYAAPAVDGRRLLVVAGSKTLAVVQVESTGVEMQRIPLPVTPALAPPLATGDFVIVPCRGPELLAAAFTGEAVWHFQFQGGKREWLDKSPVSAGNQIFAASSRGQVFALEMATGKLVWQAVVGGQRPLSQPAVEGERLVVGSSEGVVALDTRNGRSLWQFPTKRPVSAAPLIVDGQVYAADENHLLHVLDLKTGAALWRYEMPRRIETPPTLAPGVLIVSDRGGHVVALTGPSDPKPHSEPDIVVPTNTRRELAESLMKAGQTGKAAVIWYELGELEVAARLYEEAGSWPEAAGVWQQLDRYIKRAEALEQHARQISQPADVDEERKAAAWEQAAGAYAETGQKGERLRCEREVARHRNQAVLALQVEPEADLVMNAWVRLNFTVTNKGFGAARRLQVRLKDDRFEGQAARTQTIISLMPEQEYSHWLLVRPLAYGSSVPIQLVVAYADRADSVHEKTHLFNLEVAEDEEQPATTPSSTGSLEMLAVIESPDGRDLYDLRNQIVTHFNKDEVVDILFELGLQEGEFSEKKSIMARELIIGLVQHGRLQDLIMICRQRRPMVDW